MYDLRENNWKVVTTTLSAPRQLMTIVCAQKDRAIFFGGCDEQDQELATVEEIDFLKVRNSIVKLKKMREPRAVPNAFLVNDAIYVLGKKKHSMACTQLKKKMNSSIPSGEKYLLKEDKWKPIFDANRDKSTNAGFTSLVS